jgi:hypothetical protein
MTWAGLELGLLRWEAAEQPPELWHGFRYMSLSIWSMQPVHWTVTMLKTTRGEMQSQVTVSVTQ